MNCLCKDEFDWLVNMTKEGNYFRTFKDISSLIDNVLLELRYMRKKDLVIYFIMNLHATL